MEVTATDTRVGVSITGTAELHLLRMVGTPGIELTVTGHAAPDVRGRP